MRSVAAKTSATLKITVAAVATTDPQAKAMMTPIPVCPRARTQRQPATMANAMQRGDGRHDREPDHLPVLSEQTQATLAGSPCRLGYVAAIAPPLCAATSSTAASDRTRLPVVYCRGNWSGVVCTCCGSESDELFGHVQDIGGHAWNRAEGVGFEPTEACTSQLFKSCAFVRSAIPPGDSCYVRALARPTHPPAHSASSTTTPGPSRNTSLRSW